MAGSALVPLASEFRGGSAGTTEPDRVPATLNGLVAALRDAPVGVDDAGRIERIAAMEALKSALAAAQARETVAFKRSQVAGQEAAGVRAGDLGRGVASQVGLARRQSPYRASGLIGLAELVVGDLPDVLAAMAAGELSEWRAMIIAREICCLDTDKRRRAGVELAGRLDGLSDRQLAAEARKIAYRLDPQAFVERAAKAEQDRRVTIRPAPDTMTWVSALLPVKQGVALFGALSRAADRRRAGGDGRSRGQLMADTLVERATGISEPDQVPVNLTLVMSDRTLLGGGPDPAVVEGHGPIPAAIARCWLRRIPDDVSCWLRRLYTDPATGQVSRLDSRPRFFTGALRRAVVARDQVCRSPWCGAPIRHLDHPVRHVDGGPTTLANSQGLCEACNYAKEAPGWRSEPGPGGAGASITVTTPTGHRYLSKPPPMPAAAQRRPGLPGYTIRIIRWADLVTQAGP